jgi:pentatricopeptide repeat protein
MAKNQFVNDTRFMSDKARKNHRLLFFGKIAVAVIFVAIIAFAIYFISVKVSENSTDKIFAKYNSLCGEGRYEEALDVYRELYDRSLDKSLFSSDKETLVKVLLQIEIDMNKRIKEPFDRLTLKQTPFTAGELKMFEEFQEIAVRKLSAMTNEYLKGLLLGKYTLENVKYSFSELKKINFNSDILAIYEKQLPAINNFSTQMKSIIKMHDDKQYIEAAQVSQKYAGTEKGFVKDYLTIYLSDLKKEMYPVILREIDIMMTGRKFYSAKADLDKIMPFFPNDDALTKKYAICKENTKKKLVEFYGPVEHLSVRPLIADKSFRFDKDTYTLNAEDLMLTTDEFKIILQRLYTNNYVLIDIESLFTPEGKKSRIFIPEGKKPLILSIEGLNYYAARLRTGNSKQLSIDKDGHVVSNYLNENGDEITDRNGEAIGLLEQFIDQNPDFSFDGTKGTISLTGYEGVFGYVANADQIDDRKAGLMEHVSTGFDIDTKQISGNFKKVKDIIDVLKQNGWTFASSTYGGISVADSTIEAVAEDTKKWREQVGILTGPVKVLLFPNGSLVTSKDPKCELFINEGIIIQCGIGPTAYFNEGERTLFMDRVVLNGFTMRKVDVRRFFDVKEVYSSKRTKPLGK